MANPFGGFIHTSPLSSLPHDPPSDLASDCIRDYFGPTVQTVADCLRSRGPSTLSQLVSRIRSQCRRVLNEERERLVDRLPPDGGGSGGGSRAKINKARGPEHAGYVVDAAPVRAALIVLLQHSVVTASIPHHGHPPAPTTGAESGKAASAHVHYAYTFHPGRARLLPRYPRYVEHARKAIDDRAAAIVEEVLVHGRMRMEDLVRAAVDVLRHRAEGDADDDDDDDDEDGKGGMDEAQMAELRGGVVGSLKRLVEGGYLQLVPPIEEPADNDDADPDEGETELGDDGETARVGSKRKRSESSGKADEQKRKKKKEEDNDDEVEDGSAEATATTVDEDDDEPPPGVERDDPLIVSLLRGTPTNLKLFPPGTVWRVNAKMFNDSLRAFCLGRLVAERYGDRVRAAGSVVSAALKLAARKEHGPRPPGIAADEEDEQSWWEERTTFYPDEIVEYLPGPVQTVMQNMRGGAASNLSKTLLNLAEFDWPQVVNEVEEARGHPRGGKFEISVRRLVEHLRGRVLHQMVLDDHGEVAARICSILQSKGHLESDAVAEAAMVPAKDVREILHRLYKANYISLLVLQQTKQHNPSNAFYLWTVEKSRIYQTVADNVCKAFLNLRLRRQHEMELGKDWVERAKEAMDDENDHEIDRANYNKFCQGLDRLDNATLQLDETLMVLLDF